MRRAVVAITCLLGFLSGFVVPAAAAPRPVLIFVTTFESIDGDLRIKFSDGSISDPIDPQSMSLSGAVVWNSSSTPTISPDGTKVAFVGWNYACSATCAGAGSVIYTMNIDGSGLTPIYRMHDDSFEFVLDPAWSPDGSRIMFVSYYKKVDGRRRLPDLWVLDRDSMGVWTPSPLSMRPGAERWPEWSPDGKEVAYEYIRDADGWQTPGYDNRHTEIAVSPVSGEGPHKTLARSPFVTDAAYSPDGKWIAYADYNRPGDDDNEIRIMRRDGSRKRTIIRGIRWPWSLDYSPDGRFIAFGEGWKNQHERIVRVQVAAPHRMSVLVDYEGSYDHMPEYFPVP